MSFPRHVTPRLQHNLVNHLSCRGGKGKMSHTSWPSSHCCERSERRLSGVTCHMIDNGYELSKQFYRDRDER